MKRTVWLNYSKGHCQGQKGHVWLIFTHFSILIGSIEVLPKCIASCIFSEVILVLFSNFNGVIFKMVDFKGYFQDQKGAIWTFVIYLGQYLRNGAWWKGKSRWPMFFMKHIYKVIYDISVDLVIFDLGLPLNEGHRLLKGLCLINGLYDIILGFIYNLGYNLLFLNGIALHSAFLLSQKNTIMWKSITVVSKHGTLVNRLTFCRHMAHLSSCDR